MGDYSQVNLDELENIAAKHGITDQEARFPREPLGLGSSALAHIRVKPGARQPFAHKHKEAEEVHVILSGAGRLKLDDEYVDVGTRDVIRVGPSVVRAFEAGPDGLEYVVFSERREDDAEMVQGFWEDEG
jgi:mannose-6-phosphate isomerase-like protein (cupin superfamily)